MEFEKKQKYISIANVSKKKLVNPAIKLELNKGGLEVKF